MSKSILNEEDVFDMLDALLREPKDFWEGFYRDRSKEVPFFKINGPDENLTEYFHHDIKPGRVLELGCGPGRNAIYMAKIGCDVDALDISQNAIDWASERAATESLSINFICTSLFDFDFVPHSYDFVYDCGLFHHLAPHRRLTYLQLLKKALKKDGRFGIVCFTTEGAAGTPDWDVYRNGHLSGGIGYSEERFKEIFTKDFSIHTFRRMKKVRQPDKTFGEDFLWTSLMSLKN
ncbi:class I SAM-dependent methyltransferase [Metabacillus sp. JX24]|uniref:class I SAM-dependent methyltransferase n=1 Tax=Metabacillus sp. JX24 TaxID=3240759 RepID=UPI00350EA641